MLMHDYIWLGEKWRTTSIPHVEKRKWKSLSAHLPFPNPSLLCLPRWVWVSFKQVIWKAAQYRPSHCLSLFKASFSVWFFVFWRKISIQSVWIRTPRNGGFFFSSSCGVCLLLRSSARSAPSRRDRWSTTSRSMSGRRICMRTPMRLSLTRCGGTWSLRQDSLHSLYGKSPRPASSPSFW